MWFNSGAMPHAREGDTVLDPAVVLVCPSWGTSCGIAEHTRHVIEGLGRAGITATVVRSARDAHRFTKDAENVRHVIAQHEFSFFDGINSRLTAGETTAALVAELTSIASGRPDVSVDLFMHTVVQDGPMLPTQQFIRESGLRLHAFTVTGAAALDCGFLELGVHETEIVPQARHDSDFTIGNFGFLATHRMVDGYIDLCRSTGSALVANFHIPPENFPFPPEQVREALVRHLEASNVRHDLATDFMPEDELLGFLSRADCFFMPRADVGTLSASGSVRLVMNFGRPIIVNPASCYTDLAEVCLMAETPAEAVEIVNLLRRSADYRAQAEARVRAFRDRNRMSSIYPEFLRCSSPGGG